MTIGELYGAVSQLGFEESLEYESGFFHALNRAILQVNSLRPKTGRICINHKPTKNLLGAAGQSFEVDGEVTHTAVGAKSYYFEACGYGSVFIEADFGSGFEIIKEIEIISPSVFSAFFGFTKSGDEYGKISRIRFTGKHTYTVRRLAMYGTTASDDESGIQPFCERYEYDVSSIASDFLSFCDPPLRDSDGVVAEHYDVLGSDRIILSRDYPDEYTVFYNTRPPLYSPSDTAEENNEEIPLDDDLCVLLPLLIASYVWLDDEPQKAEYYFSLYRDRASEIVSSRKNHTVASIKSSDGW